MTDHDAREELRLLLLEMLSQERRDAVSHALQAIEDRAALCDACEQEDYLKPIYKAFLAARRHTRGED